MTILTAPIYDLLVVDLQLTSMLSLYKNLPSIFTIDPVPGDASLPYIVTAGDVSHVPNDTKTDFGRNIIRDIRCYTAADGSSILVESIAERVRFLLHRKPISINGYNWVISNCSGPIKADEVDVYGRILSLTLIAYQVGS